MSTRTKLGLAGLTAACLGITPALAQDELDDLFADEPASSSPAPISEGDTGSTPPAAEQDTKVIKLAAEPPPAAPDIRQPNRRVIEEIVVTAQKTEQGLRDVPISVTAIGGDQLKESAITDAADLVQYTPNVKMSEGFSATTSVSIRGFGTPPLARAIEPSVGLVIDDVFYGRTSFISDGIYDLKRLEVLRGPQGTLFGKNTVAGVMNFTTNEASMDGLEQSYTGAVASENGMRLEGAFATPFTDTLGMRLSFRARQKDSGIYNTTREFDENGRDFAARLKLRWEPSDTLALDLTLLTADSEQRGIGFQLDKATERALSVAREQDPETEDDAYDGRASTNSETFFGRRSNSIALKASKDFDQLLGFESPTLTAIANYATVETPFRFDSDSLPINFNTLGTLGPEEYQQQSLELRFTGGTDGLFGIGENMDWIGGLFYFGSSFSSTQLGFQHRSGFVDFARAGGAGLIPEGSPDSQITQILTQLGIPVALLSPTVGTLLGEQDRESVTNILLSDSDAYAAFLQTTWYLSDRLSTVIGLRLGREDKSALQSSERGQGNFIATFAGQQNFSNTASRSEDEITPKIALSYDLNDEITLFGNITQGFKSGGFSGPLVAPTALDYEPEQSISSELGIKSRLLEGSLVFNATAFYVKFDDLQLTINDGVNVATTNASAATAYGMEIDYQWLPRWEFLSLAGSFGYTNASYDDFPCGPAPIFAEGHEVAECDPGGGAPTVPPDRRAIQPGATQDLSGDPLAFVPRITASFTPSVKLPISIQRGIGALIGVDVLYQGEQWLDVDLDPQMYQGATTKINARIGIANIDGDWSILLNAKNLTGENERAIALDSPSLPNNYIAITSFNEPTWSLDFRYNFAE